MHFENDIFCKKIYFTDHNKNILGDIIDIIYKEIQFFKGGHLVGEMHIM